MSEPGIVTYAPDGVSDRRWLSPLGAVSQAAWGSTMPGGDDQFTCTIDLAHLQREPALYVGRILQVIASGATLYEGRLDKPAPSGSGWTVTAHGSGSYGDDYNAIWTTHTASDIITQAVGRGLRWTAGTLTGGNLGQVNDSGSQKITQFLNDYTDTVSLTWMVDQPGNVLQVFAVPTTPTRLLVTTVPAAPDLIDYINDLYVRYQSSADGAATQTYGLTHSQLAASVTAHGRTEDYWDVTTSGQLTATAAQNLAAGALAKYVSASFSQAFTALPGQYMTMGGVPVDLMTERAGEVVRLIIAAGGFSGEIGPVWPVQFPVGAVAYNHDQKTLAITPYQSVRSDLNGLLGILIPPPPPKLPPPPRRVTVPRRPSPVARPRPRHPAPRRRK